MKYISFIILLFLATPVEGVPLHFQVDTLSPWSLTIPGRVINNIELFVANQPLDGGYRLSLARAYGVEDIIILSNPLDTIMLLNLTPNINESNYYVGSPTGILRYLNGYPYIPDSTIPVNFFIHQFEGHTMVSLDVFYEPILDTAPEPSTLLLLGSTLILIGRKILRIAR